MKPFTPIITKIKPRSVLTITTVGTPNKTALGAMPALYGTAYGTKFKVFKPKRKEMTIGACSARWPDAHLKPKSKWTGVWALEIPAFVKQRDLIQKNPKLPAKIIKWPGGMVAEILYIGLYAKEGPTIKRLHAFIKSSGYKVAGSHEEVYLSRPGPRAKTLIRYRIKPVKK